MNVRFVLFESPYSLIPILVGLEIVLLHFWSRRRTPLTGWTAVGGLIAIPLLVAVQILVVTDRERIIRICRELAKATAQADTTALGRHIAANFAINSPGRVSNKAGLLDEFERILSKWDVEEERLSAFDVAVDGHTARATFHATCRLISNDLMIPRHVSKWKLEFAKLDTVWLVTHIRPSSTPPWKRGSLPDLFH